MLSCGHGVFQEKRRAKKRTESSVALLQFFLSEKTDLLQAADDARQLPRPPVQHCLHGVASVLPVPPAAGAEAGPRAALPASPSASVGHHHGGRPHLLRAAVRVRPVHRRPAAGFSTNPSVPAARRALPRRWETPCFYIFGIVVE